MKQTREKIIDAAKVLFEKNGYSAATTREIAELAGVSEVTLFRHFETKRNLFELTVHSCMHPYKLQDYLKTQVQYDLDVDLKEIAFNMMETYQQNLPMIKMIFKDQMGATMSKMDFRHREHNAQHALVGYFEKMHTLGKINVDPKMAFKFFITNVTGFFLKGAFTDKKVTLDKKYLAWMIEKIVVALRS